MWLKISQSNKMTAVGATAVWVRAVRNDIEFWIYPEHATNTCPPIKIQRLTIFGIAPLFIYFQLDKNSPIFCEGLAIPKTCNACKASLFYLVYLIYLNVST